MFPAELEDRPEPASDFSSSREGRRPGSLTRENEIQDGEFAVFREGFFGSVQL